MAQDYKLPDDTSYQRIKQPQVQSSQVEEMRKYETVMYEITVGGSGGKPRYCHVFYQLKENKILFD